MMDWNLETPSLWNWDHHQPPFDGGYKLPGNSGGNGGGGGSGGAAGLELGNCCSSKSSFLASNDSSSKVGKEPTLLSFEAYPDKIKYLPPDCASPLFNGGVRSEETLISLKLGKRTYFEELNMENDAKKIVLSSGSTLTASPVLVKKPRASNHSLKRAVCQVEGCDDNLSSGKDYHRKHRVCEKHTKCPRVIVGGQERRFCQQCSRFHDLSEFDQKKRSCRKRLSDHNARRRKPQPDIISLSSSSFFLSAYDEKHADFLWNTSTSDHLRSNVNSSWNSYDLKLPAMGGRLITKAEDFGSHLPGPEILQNTFCRADNLSALKGSNAKLLNQGSEAYVEDLSIDEAPEIRRVLSLLSTSSWVSPDSGHTSIFHIPATNSTCSCPSSVHSLNSTSEHWGIAVSQDQETRAISLEMQNSSSHLPKFQTQKETYGTTHFCSNRIN